MRRVVILIFTACLLPVSAWAQTEETHVGEVPNLHITAHPFGRTLLETVAPSTVINGDQIHENGGTSLGALLQNEPGVSASSFAPGASRPIIRGAGGERVRILRNGVGSFDVANVSDDHPSPVNPFSTQSVEILRGPATLFYGSSAIGGVVNVTDNLILEEPLIDPLSGEIVYRAGSGSGESSGGGKLEGKVGDLNLHLGGFYQQTEDVNIPGFAKSDQLRRQQGLSEDDPNLVHGKLANSATRTKGVEIGTSSASDNGFFGVGFSHFESLYGVPGETVDSATQIDAEQNRFDLRGALKEPLQGIRSLKIRMGAGEYHHDELDDGAVSTTFKQHSFEGRVEALHHSFYGFEGAIGTQMSFNDLSATGEEMLLPPSTTAAPAAFIFEEHPLTEKLKLQLGGRYDLQMVDAAGFENQDFNLFSGSVGVLFDPLNNHDYGIGLSLARSARAPQPTELFSNGPHDATRTFEVGDPNLDPETSWGADLTFKKNTGFWNAVVNLFYQRYQKYIAELPTGDMEDDLPVFAFKNTGAEFRGFELDNVFNVLTVGAVDVDLLARLDYVHAENLTANEPLPRIPPFRTQLGLRTETMLGAEHLGAQIDGIFVSKQDRISDNELPTDGYTLLNTSLHYTVPVGKNDLTFFVRGTNLNNAEARVHTSFLKDIAPLGGRTVLFGVEGVF